MSVIYEVNLELDSGLLPEYLPWLREHVREILALPGFLAAEVFSDGTGTGGLVVHYRLRDRAALDSYLEHHAPRLRAEGEARFGGRFRAWRRILDPLRPDRPC